jgi:dipeptidyl-peptidase-4
MGRRGWMRWLGVGVAAMVVAGSAVAADGGLTLQGIFGGDAFDSTIPSTLMWLPEGKAFLFRQKRAGVDGLWREEAASGKVTLVVDWSSLEQSLKGARPGYVKPPMDDVNSHPNLGRSPSISPDGTLYLGAANDDLYVLELATGHARYITDDPAEERFATFSPDGSKVAFVRNGDLYWVDLPGGAEHRLTDRNGAGTLLNGRADWLYEEELGVTQAFWWSPDGTRIAYLQFDTSPVELFPVMDQLTVPSSIQWQRYPLAGHANPKVRLGVVSLLDRATQWVDTGGETDAYLPRAGWLPSGEGVWYELLNRPQTHLELRTATPPSASPRVVLREDDPAWINLNDDLTFVDDHRFIWGSERDGFNHLYLYDLDGALVRRLTHGRWQVDAVYGLDRGKTRVYFKANAEDPRQRHIYSIGLDGTRFTRLVSAPGTHDATLAPGATYFLDTFSTITTPPRLDLYDGDGHRVRTVDDGAIAALAGLQLSTPELGTLASDNGDTLYWWMIRPPDFDPHRKYPVLVYVYGGPHEQMVVDEWAAKRGLFYQVLASKGLVIFCLDNHGSWGRGHAFEAVIKGHLGKWELADQLAGVRYLENQPWTDRSRIGVYGGSYGGYMALTCMNEAPEHFSVGIAYAPVSDWRLYDSAYTERYMGMPKDNSEGYRESAPLNFAAGLNGRLLICHGTMDNNVHVQNSIQMGGAYIKADKVFEMILYPRTRHGIRVSRWALQFHTLKADFLERTLLSVPGITH